jgi:transcriptional regulator GlxA family with amidase domain
MDPTVTRRTIIAAAGLAGASALVGGGRAPTLDARSQTGSAFPRPDGPVPVAFLLDENATMIDFTGPWEVFQDAGVADVPGFNLFTVAPTAEPLRATGGMKIVPDYTIENAPPAKVIVVPAQAGGRQPIAGSPKVAWLRAQHQTADIIMSVCTGAFLLAQTGLLKGLSATTHHLFLEDFAKQYPDVRLLQNQRFVDNGRIITAGGLSSGIEGALHVVERYYGPTARSKVANYMEYVSHTWSEA